MPLCCGRPLYAWGMLDLGKKLLTQVLETLRSEIDAGVPVVGLEPACIATFRDELPNLFPDNERAQRLSKQSFMLGEFLARNGHEPRSEEHTSELQSLMRTSYAGFCLKKKKKCLNDS